MTGSRLSGAERGRARGAGMVVLRPPGEGWRRDGWHLLRNASGQQKRMLWQAGIEVWRDAAGERFPAERIGKAGWTYDRPLSANPTVDAIPT